MRTNWKRTTAAIAAFLFLITGFMSACPPAAAGGIQSYPSVRASQLLAEIQGETATLSADAAQLQALTRHPQYHWQTHAEYLNRLKLHVHAVGERTAELQQIGAKTLPWQQSAIKQVTSHAAQMAASTQAAILYLNDNPGRLFVPEYQSHVAQIADSSQNMKQTVDQFLDYEKTQQRFQRLQYQLELAVE